MSVAQSGAPILPIQLLNPEAREEKGDVARMSAFVGAIAIADLVKTTLGPKGQDKILQSIGRDREVTVTNDGATILKSVITDNPAAKVLIEISKTQDDEVGDGTTSVCVLAGELMREGEKLIALKVHPQTIVAGWRQAVQVAREALIAEARDHKSNPEEFRRDLLNIARTTLSSKILQSDKEHFANICVDAVTRLKGSTNLDSINIIKKLGGSLRDSYLDEGFILEKKIGVNQPKRMENPKILIANTAMDTDKIKIFGARVRTDSTAKVAEIEEAEREKMFDKCQKIIDHGVNCFINRQLIYNLPEQYFADRGVMAIEHADFDGIERLALVLGAEIVSTFDHPELVKLGTCKVIEEAMIGEDMVLKFSGVALGEACTIILRGASKHMLDEAERSVHDALCVLSQTATESRVIYGGGCTEMLMAKAIDEAAAKVPGKRALAMNSFATALRQIPSIIADNAGYDASELVTQLRAAHNEGKKSAGLDMNEGRIGDMAQLGITESLKVKSQILTSAAEAAEMIVRVDEILRSAPRKREADPRLGGRM